MRKMTPAEALELAMTYVGGCIRNGPGGRPGEVIEKMPEKVREALKELKAEHTQDRVDWFL